MTGFFLDLQSALRGLFRSRAVALLAVGCLGLGVGTCAAMLGMLDVLLLRPPEQVRDTGRLRRVYFADTYSMMGERTSSVTSYPVFLDLEKVRSFAALGAYVPVEVSLGRGEGARRARAVLVTPGFLRLLGVKPEEGRLFLEAEGLPGRPGFIALLSHELWRRGFGGAADIVGQPLVLGRDVYTVIGVMPRRFTGVDLAGADLWLPINAAGLLMGPDWATSRGSQFLQLVARLGGSSPDAAAGEATTVYRAALAEAGWRTAAARVRLGPIHWARGPEIYPGVRVATWLAGLSWLVLLVACANVASLLLVRALDRRPELAVRLALGAGSWRIARLLLLESGLLAAAGGLAGLAVFRAETLLLQRLILPQAGPSLAGWTPRVLLILAVLTIVAALLSGAVPALWSRRVRLSPEIRSGAREAPRSRLSAAVVSAQIALTVLLLAGAGGFVHSLDKVMHLDLGLDAGRVVVATAGLEAAGYPPARVDEIFHSAAERLRPLPGVEKVGLAAGIPFFSSFSPALAVPGVERLPELSTGGPYANAVSEDFFAATGTAVLRGRAFSAGDRAGSEPVAIVNQTMARLLWPGRDALGRCLRIDDEKAPCSVVVGVVEDARRQRLQEEATMQYYLPLGQAPAWLASRALFVRPAGEPESLAPLVRSAFHETAPDLPFIEVRPLSERLEPQIRPWRMGAEVLTLFGLLALGLAVVGLFGVVAHAMARRRYELGVRIALGAQWRDVLGLALRQGLFIGLGGAAAGLGLALAAARFLQPLLFEVSAKDPVTLGIAAGVVLLPALLASLASAYRVRAVDPAAVLRVE
jgi:predicted permease